MPRRSVSGGQDALALLKLASEIPQDYFAALRDAATIALSIIETVMVFASNIKKSKRNKKYKGECASCARYVENAVTNFMRSLGAQDSPGREDVRETMKGLLESLEKVKGEISRVQQASVSGPSSSSSGRYLQSIADMKAQVHAILTPFGPLLEATDAPDGMDAQQLLARITERDRGTAVVANRVTESVVNQDPSDHANELIMVQFDETRPVFERSLNRIGSASVADQNTSASHVANELMITRPVVFNTTAASGANVMNVAGNYITYGPCDEHSVLEKLVCADGVSWDPKRVCLPGTRVNMLSVIHAWSRSFDAQNIFWLNGVAGAGKSAIAHTIAQALHEEGILASSFFFDRNDAARNTPQRLVSTIARDIAVRHPAIAADISAALEEEPSLASAPLSRQFEAFILGPLRRHPVDHPIVVVIDALDETISDDSDTSLLAMLCDEASHLPPQLRILITSRPTWIVEQYLSGPSHIVSHPIDIHSLDNRQDIAAYVDAQLRDPLLRSRMGPNWPDEALIAELKTMAEGLFIWIATICNYLRSAYKPRAKLEGFLSKSTPQGLPASKKMDVLYASILELCADWEDPDFLKDYDLVIGAIMAAKKPLSLMALKALHGANHPLELSADVLLERFGSVLVGFKTEHEPIRMLHVSFREFVTNNANNTEHTHKFYISEKLHSQRLAELCLQTMVREFTAGNLSGTGYLARAVDDPPGIPEVTGVSEQLLYSCESWSNHTSDLTEPNPIIVEYLRAFLLDHTTVWMEVVSSKSVFLGLQSVFCWSKDHPPENRELYGQASALSSLSRRLSYVGRLEEALTAGHEAVYLYRNLAADLPAVFNGVLAHSLTNLSVHMSAIGEMEGAVSVVQEAVPLFRTLAAEDSAGFSGHLATSLSTLSVHLSEIGEMERALSVAQEVVPLLRTLAAEDPAGFNDHLATSLSNLSIDLTAIGKMEGALTVVQEAVDLHRVLAAERPAVLNANLAGCLNQLSACLSAVGRKEEAVPAAQDAVDLHRVLAAERPAAFSSALACSLTNSSVALSGVGRKEEARTAVQEAVHMHRALAAERPAVFSAPLATSLNNLSTILSGDGRKEEALTVAQEVVDLRRALATERPGVFNAPLADSLTRVSIHLSAVGRKEEALTAVQEVVDLRRVLATECPDIFNAPLATSLSDLSTHLSAVGRKEEALTALQEAVYLRRALVTKCLDVLNASLANSLTNLCAHLSDAGRTEEALMAAQEAVDIHRALAAEPPTVWNASFANSLTNLCTHLSDAGRTEEAQAAAQEAADLHRVLAAEQPAMLNTDIVHSLANLSAHLSAVGRTKEALKAELEELDLLAHSYIKLSAEFSAVGKAEHALTAVQEAVALYQLLVEDQPTVYHGDLAYSLEMLSTITRSMQRGPDE